VRDRPTGPTSNSQLSKSPPPGDDRAVSGPAAGGGSPLASAALPLLDLVGRVQFLAQPLDLEALRVKVIEELQLFERHAAAPGLAPDRTRVAHYVLSATIDDILLSAPWGAYSVWARHSMVWTFHKDATSSDRFFDILARKSGICATDLQPYDKVKYSVHCAGMDEKSCDLNDKACFEDARQCWDQVNLMNKRIFSYNNFVRNCAANKPPSAASKTPSLPTKTPSDSSKTPTKPPIKK
jgi:hypothetical protein